MALFTTLLNAVFLPGRPILGSTGIAFRDNIVAGLECDPTAPVNMAGWHPFNKVANNDAANGAIWTFAANGAVAAVTSPDFLDGWDYAFLIDRVNTSANGGAFSANLFRDPAGAYAGVTNTALNAGGAFNSQLANSFLEIANPRRSALIHELRGLAQNTNGVNATSGVSSAAGVRAEHATLQRILRVQFTFSAGNITGTGAGIYMYRRRAL
jgi:hypothetical protein